MFVVTLCTRCYVYRFSLNGNGGYEKNGDFISCPDELEVCGKKYILKCVVNHHGYSMGAGHYTSHLKRGGRYAVLFVNVISDYCYCCKFRFFF